MLQLSYQAYTLSFRFEAGTSRGVLRERPTFFLLLKDQTGTTGIGEAAPLEKLSIDSVPNFEGTLAAFCQKFNRQHYKDLSQTPSSFWEEMQQSEFANFPSITFAIETALADYKHGGKRKIFDNAFSNGNKSLAINGLIWMGKPDFMLKQVADKLAEGYNCLKMKIGAINFEEELAILKHIRKEFSAQQITLRVDANGAFAPEQALEKLKQLADFDLHSIEQPIQAGQIDKMAMLAEKTPIPIALDEELIGIHAKEEKINLLKQIKPAYIILKPTLVGGLQACDEWIEIAENQGISWWITSALESNVGLNVICQYTAEKVFGTKYEHFHQGLGTGQLYHNNITSPLEVSKGLIHYRKEGKWLFLE
jgi:o-succinylbenzoate synthase